MQQYELQYVQVALGSGCHVSSFALAEPNLRMLNALT